MSFKICSVGCGYIANAMHGPSYLKYRTENRDTVFAGCCDTDAGRSKEFKEKFGFLEHFTDLNGMLDRCRPDAVCLLSPVHVTPVLAGRILEMGYPLLLEKPPGRTKEEVIGLMKAAAGKKVPHMVAFNRRFAPLSRKLRELLEAGYPSGHVIQSLQYDMFRVNRLDEDFSTTAIHAIDAVRFITGSDYRHITFVYHEYPQLGANIADIHMLCTMSNGIVAQLNICPATGICVERAVVNLRDNTLFLDYMKNELNTSSKLISVEKNKITQVFGEHQMPDDSQPFEKEGFYYENKIFFDDIRAGRRPAMDLQASLQSVEVADCIRKRLPAYTA